MNTKKKRILSRLVAMAAACILILYAAVHIPELSTSEIAEHFHLLVIESAKETYLTSLTYAQAPKKR